MIDEYIYPCYETLHSESRENFHYPATKLYLYNDNYIADSYLIEKGLHKIK